MKSLLRVMLALIVLFRHGSRSLAADYFDPRNLQPLIDISAKYGLIPKAFPATEIISSAAAKP
jgi:hypothetical protein